MANEEIVVSVKLDNGEIVKGFAQIERKSKEAGINVGSNLDKAFEGLEQAAPGVANSFTNISSKITAALTNPFLLAGTAVASLGLAAKAALDLTLEGEKLNKIEKQFFALSESVGIAGESLKGAFLESLGGLVDDSDAIQSLNKALVSLGSRAEQLPQIMELARKATNAFGGDVTDRFEAINQAIATGATRQLRAIGININAEQAYKKYAETIGISVDVLSEAGKQQAILNAVIEKGEKKFAGVALEAGGATSALQRVSVSLNNIFESFQQFVAKNYGEAFASVFNTIDIGLKKLTGNFTATDRIKELNKEIEDTQTRINQLTFAKFERETSQGFIGFIKSISDNEGSLFSVKKNLEESKNKLAELNKELIKAKGINETGKPTDQVNSKTTTVDDSIDLEAFTKKKEKIEFDYTQFLFSQQQARAQSTIAQNNLVLAQDLDAKNKLALIDENFNITQRLSEEKLANDKLTIKEKYKNDGLLGQQTANAQIEQLDITHKQALLLQEQQFQQQRKQYQDQANFETLSGFEAVGAGMQNVGKGFSEAVTEFSNNSVKNFQNVGKQAFATLGQGVGQAFAKFGQALASGEDAGKVFLESMLGIFADVAIQLGTSFIMQGIAHSLNPLTPGLGGPLIGAGAALATFGGVLKSLSGGKSQATGGADTGGGIAASPSSTTEFTPDNKLERKDPDTKINLTIQGDILDSDESGSRIVSLINSAFDKKGVVLNQGFA